MYIFLLLGIILSIWASVNVKSKFRKYSNKLNTTGWTADEIAMWILRQNGINDVSIEHIEGELTDHYDPRDKVLRLSDNVYRKKSIAAVGVAAHECGHAIQHAYGYGPLELRSKLVPIANIGSHASEIFIFIGILFGFTGMLNIGILLFSAVVMFYMVTLPVEFNASNRACAVLKNSGYFGDTELSAVRKVLNAAAMTYVASALVAVLQLIRLIAISRD